jgi:transcriptional regulator with XRE-family HTH domain
MVTIRKAVKLLRTKASLDQAALAALAETTVETVSRWENGRRAPSSEALQQLASIAGEKGQPELRAVFESKRKDRIDSRRKRLPSAGTQRRISVEDLKFNAAVARYLDGELGKALILVKKELEQAKERSRLELLEANLKNALVYVGFQLDETELHIAEPYGSARMEEDQKLLRRPPKSMPYGLQAAPPKERTKYETTN